MHVLVHMCTHTETHTKHNSSLTRGKQPSVNHSKYSLVITMVVIPDNSDNILIIFVGLAENSLWRRPLRLYIVEAISLMQCGYKREEAACCINEGLLHTQLTCLPTQIVTNLNHTIEETMKLGVQKTKFKFIITKFKEYFALNRRASRMHCALPVPVEVHVHTFIQP